MKNYKQNNQNAPIKTNKESGQKSIFRVPAMVIVSLPLFIAIMHHEAKLNANNNFLNKSREYYVFRGKDKTTIYDTFEYKGQSVDYTRDLKHIGLCNGITEVSEIYSAIDISKVDLLIQEQTANRDGIIVFIDNNGVASFYENYQLVEKIDLVSKKVIDITEESETLVANPEKAHEYSKQKKLIK